MKNKIWKNLEKLIIFLLLISFLGCQSEIVYGMSYSNNREFTQTRPTPSGGGGGGTYIPPITPPTNPDTDASSSIDEYVTLYSTVGIYGNISEEIESINSTKIGTSESDEASKDSQNVGIAYHRVTIVDNDTHQTNQATTTTDENGNYQFNLSSWSLGPHSYHLEYTYPDVTKSEIDAIKTIDDAQKIQSKLKYNGQDYQASDEKSDFSTIVASGKSAAQVYLVLDCSASMDDEIEITENGKTEKKRKIDIEKQVATNIINSLLSGNKNIYVGLVVFTGVCYRRVALTNNAQTLIDSLKGNIEFSDTGYTNIKSALEKANNSFINTDESNSNRYIFLLSDGLPTSDGNDANTLYYVDPSSPDAASITAENDQKLQNIANSTKQAIEDIENSKVKIYSIIATQDLDDNDKAMLNNIFIKDKNKTYNTVQTVEDISKITKDIVNDFEEYVKKSIEIENKGYSAKLTDRENIKANFSKFNFSNTKIFTALDMKVTDNESLETFKTYAKELLDKTSVTVSTKPSSVTLTRESLPNPNPEIQSYTDENGNEIVTKRIHYSLEDKYEPGPNIYLTKLPQYTITPKISVTGLAVVASTGTVIDRQVTTTEEAENLISTIEKDLLYGSTAVVRYTVDVTNTSLYNDTNTVSILFYVPDGFTCDTKSVSAVGIGENNKKQKLNVTNITSLTADTIDTYSDEFLSGEAIKKIQGKGNGSKQPTSAIAVTVQVKDDSHYVLPTNGSIKININTTKLLGNDEEMSYGADAEILSYSNDSYKRIEYKAKASSSAVSQVAVAGNASTEEKDYTKTSNKGIILLPTGGDKRMLKQRILLVILVSACGIIIYKLKKSEKDKHNK